MISNLQSMADRVRLSASRELFLAVFLALVPAAGVAQTATSSPLETDEKLPRKNLFGTQVAPDKAVPILREVASPEPASDILQRTGTAHNNQKIATTVMVAEGAVTVYTAGGTIAFGVTLIQNGEQASQRILLRQPDGKLWDGRGDHLAAGGRQALEFLQTQQTRGLLKFLSSPNRSATIVDNGIKNASRMVTVLEENGDSTKYILDPATSRMTRFEFVRGQSRDAVGNATPIVQSYAFADVRTADGIATPFHIEHSVNGVKHEELQLTKVRYNAAGISAPAVRPTGR